MAGVHMPLAKISSCATISRDCMTNDSRVATEKRTKAAATSNIESHQSLGQCAVRSYAGEGRHAKPKQGPQKSPRPLPV